MPPALIGEWCKNAPIEKGEPDMMDWAASALAQYGLGWLPAALGVEHLGLFVMAGIVLNLTPGVDVLYVVTQAARGGRRAGVAAALGIVAGCFVHVGAAALGLSALIAASSTAFAALKYLGAAYLMWVGWTLLHTRFALLSVAVSADGIRAGGQKSLIKIFTNGFWTNVLNQKVALFFLAFLPQFIAPDAAHKTLAFVLLGLVFNLNSLWVNLGFAWLGASLGNALSTARSPRWVGWQGKLHWLERTAGAMFIAFGLKLALSDNPAH